MAKIKQNIKVKVKFFTTFRQLFGTETKDIELESGTDIEALLHLLCDSRRCRQELFDNSGNIKQYVKILKNGRHIEFLDGTHTKLEEGDVVAMFPPAAGG